MEKTKKNIVITAVVSIIVSLIYEIILKFGLKISSMYFIDKVIVDSMVLFFIGLHLVLGISKLYDFIIKNRYKIAAILLIVFTLLQYSGSSNGVLVNWILEPEKDNTLLGFPRGIRSDEYGLETLVAVSQKNNDYKYNNENLRGVSTDVFSILDSPVKDIVSVGRLYNLGHILLKNSSMGIAFAWNLKLLSLILISYELCSLITNKNKGISIVGTILISFSGFIQWWSIIDVIIYGELAIVLLNKILCSPKFSTRVLCLVGITIAAISYVFIFYPPYMIAFGYVFLSLAIWIIIKNIKQYKIYLKDIFAILCCLAFLIFVLIRYFNLSSKTLEIIRNTSYPGERFETGGNGIAYLFSYLYNFLLPYMDLGDNCAYASIISIFPIPMIIAIYYLYKKEKHVSFLLPLSIVAFLETVFCLSGFPKIVSELTLFKYVIVERAAVAVGFANVYLMLYMLANIDEEIVSVKSSIRISILLMFVIAFVPLPGKITTRVFLSIISGILCMYIFLFLNSYDQRYKKVLLSTLTIFTLVGAFYVNPITKGTYAITDTDFARKVQEICKEDKDAKWMSLEDMMILSNYAMANGAQTLNSTNTYPNKELFEKILGKELAKEKADVWNRYSHIIVGLSDENSVELIEKDKIRLSVTPEKLKELDVKYIITYEDGDILLSNGIKVEELYKKESSKAITINKKEVNKISIYKILDN